MENGSEPQRGQWGADYTKCTSTSDIDDYAAYFTASSVLAIFSLISCLIALIVLYRYRNRPVFMMSQRWFLFGIIISLIGVAISVLLHTLFKSVSSGVCIAISSILNISLTALLATAFTKEYRIYILETRTRRLKRVNMRMMRFPHVMFALIIMVLTTDIAWFLIDPPAPTECASFLCRFGGIAVFALVLIGIQYLAIIVLCIKTFRISPVASESRAILLLCALVALFAGVFTLAAYAFKLPYPVLKFLYSSIFFVFLHATIALIIFRKLQWVRLTSKQVMLMFASRAQRLKDAKSSEYTCSQPERSSTPEINFNVKESAVVVTPQHGGSKEGDLTQDADLELAIVKPR
mmetsp:Transcript_11252/g.18375  ORF Transcript_11252/g.18375 Transcript_11252/m.18375 type:complete len:349 (-) Transcript_11252:3426-4472(-)